MKHVLFCVVVVWVATQVAGAVDIGIGSTRDEVIQTLGRPKGTMSFGGREALTFDGGVVELEKERVVYIDPQFDSKTLKAQKDREFADAQTAKGLVLYDGRWMNPSEQQSLEEKRRKKLEQEEAKRKRQEQLDAQNRARNQSVSGGQEVDIQGMLAEGQVTVIDFYADWCGPCKRLAPALEKLAQGNPDVALRKIDIVNWGSPVSLQYNITSIPNVWVFDRNGKRVGSPSSDFKTISQNVRRAL